MKSKFRKKYSLEKPQGEKFKKESLTIPDQTMSIKEIMTRYTRGLPLTDVKTPIYHGEEAIGLDIRKMDISEIADMAEENREYIEKEKVKMEQAKKDKEEREAEERITNKIKKQQDEKERKEKTQLPKNDDTL